MNKWDERYLEMAELVATWSKDPSTKVGAVIVRPDKTIASVGYNGFPRGCLDDPKYYKEREVKYARVIHAEMNAILNAKEPLGGYTLYTTFPTCSQCAASIIQAGIKRVVWRMWSTQNGRWRGSVSIALQMYQEAGVEKSEV